MSFADGYRQENVIKENLAKIKENASRVDEKLKMIKEKDVKSTLPNFEQYIKRLSLEDVSLSLKSGIIGEGEIKTADKEHKSFLVTLLKINHKSDTESLKKLASDFIEKGANINACDENEDTAFSFAIAEKKFDFADFLLEKKVNPMADLQIGKIKLNSIIQEGHIVFAKKLLDYIFTNHFDKNYFLLKNIINSDNSELVKQEMEKSLKEVIAEKNRIELIKEITNSFNADFIKEGLTKIIREKIQCNEIETATELTEMLKSID